MLSPLDRFSELSWGWPPSTGKPDVSSPGSTTTFTQADFTFPAWNVGNFLFGFWLGSMNLMRFVNLVVWRNTSENLAPAWCGICWLTFYFVFTFIHCEL